MLGTTSCHLVITDHEMKRVLQKAGWLESPYSVGTEFIAFNGRIDSCRPDYCGV